MNTDGTCVSGQGMTNDRSRSGILGGVMEPVGKELDHINELTQKIIGCSYEVSNLLGAGFLEKVYENALAIEMRAAGLRFSQQQSLPVFYRGTLVGDFVADFVVDGRVILELKAVKGLDEVHSAQCLNYLRATGLWICLLLNFGRPKLEHRRIVQGVLGEGRPSGNPL